MTDNIISLVPKSIKEEELIEYVKITYSNSTSEVLNSDTWGASQDIPGFMVFCKSTPNDEGDIILGFRNLSHIFKIDVCNKHGEIVGGVPDGKI